MKSKVENSSSLESHLDEVIFIEKLNALYGALQNSSVANILIALTLVLMLRDVVDQSLLIVWLSFLSGINILRFASAKFYLKQEKSLAEAIIWNKVFFSLMFSTGITWACVSVFLLPDNDVIYHYLPILILIGTSAGAINSLSYNLKYIAIYLALLLLPILIFEIIAGTYLSNLISALLILFMFVSMSNSKRFNKTFIENVSLRYHAEKNKQELIVSKDEAIEANKMKGQFVSMISHELRTPLNAIIGFGQLLQMSDEPKLSAEQSENTQDILDAGYHLASLIEELLDLSSIESNKVKLFIEDTSFIRALNESLKLLKPIAYRFKIELINRAEKDYYVIADAKRLKQILINLISNAIKYNHENGKVTITVNEAQNKKIRISISDTGEGLSEKQIKGLFQPFKRYDYEKEGLGLGLYISQNMVSLMGGEIGIESVVGAGSTFWFEIPLAEEIS